MNRKINHIHEKALRLIYQDYASTFEELLHKDKSVCIHHLNIRRVAVEMYKVKNDMCPDVFKFLFHKNKNPLSNAFFKRPNVNKVHMGEESISYFGPIVWDRMLPENIRSITTLEEFKVQINKWIPDNCPCRLCKNYVQNLGFIQVYE